MKIQPLVTHVRLPDAMRRSGHSQWGWRHRGDAGIHSWLEAPLVDESGGIMFVDVAYGRILRADLAGRIDLLIEYEGAPNGLARRGSELLVADGQRGLMWMEQSASGLIPRREVGDWMGTSLLGLNDLAIGNNGSVYITDQGMSGLHDPSGRILCWSVDGMPSVLLGAIPSPNGIAVDLEQQELLVAVTRDNAIWRVPLDENHAPFRVGRFIQMSGGVGPDGIALAEDGTLFVAHLGMGIVWVYDGRGRKVGGFETPEGANPTNVAHVGESGEIYVTEADAGVLLVGDVRAVTG